MSYQPLFLGLGTAVIRTVAGTNILEGETANLRVGQPVVSRQESTTHVFGGVTANTVYYIKEIVDANNFKISLTVNGDVTILQDGQGFMLFRAVQREMVGESLRKVDAMLEEIYSEGIGIGGGDGGDIDGGSASSIFDPTPVGVVGGILSIIEDETPALGGNLSLNGNNIFGTGNVNISGNINATVFSGEFRGVLAGSLIGPVDSEGVRTGNPTIDGLPFELGNPQSGQVISWDGPNQKFTLVSVSAVTGSDTLDDVLFRGNSSLNSITVGRAITSEVEGANDELNIYSNWAKDTGVSIFSGTGTESVTLTSDRIVAVVTNVGLSQQQWIFETDGDLLLPSGGDIKDAGTGLSVLGGVDIGDFIFTGGDASLVPGSTMTLSTFQSGGNKESKLTLSTSTISSLDAGNNFRIRVGNGTGFEQDWQFGATGAVTFPDATVQTTAFTGSIDYSDVVNTPTLATVATSGSYTDLSNTPIFPTLATVATSGSYTDLSNTPTIPSTLLGLGITDGSVGQVLTTNGAGGFTFTTVSGGGTGLGSRTTASATTGALLVNAVGNISITGFKTYALLGMTVEIPAWVRLYTTSAARTADASRLETEDPSPGSGVIAEVITTSNNQTVSFTPATIGFNGDAPAATTIYASVKNKGSGLATIQVTLTLVQLEA